MDDNLDESSSSLGLNLEMDQNLSDSSDFYSSSSLLVYNKGKSKSKVVYPHSQNVLGFTQLKKSKISKHEKSEDSESSSSSNMSVRDTFKKKRERKQQRKEAVRPKKF